MPDYEVADSAPEGLVDDADTSEIPEMAVAGNFVLSRTNAPLARVCLDILRSGKRAVIRGRDIGATLSNLAKKIIENSAAHTIEQFAAGTENWRTNMKDLLKGQDAPESSFDFVDDQADTMLTLAEGLAAPKELLTRINSLFSDNNVGNSVICSTVHKAKGLESDRVFVLSDSFRRSGEEEDNITYVAYTRAKAHLTLAQGETT